MKEVCGNCKYNKRDFKPQNTGYAEFCCGNEDSEWYGATFMMIVVMNGGKE